VTTIRFRRGSDIQWSTANPTLAVGEPGYDIDTGAVVVGDGSSPWDGLRAIGTTVLSATTALTSITVGPGDVGAVIETTSGSAVTATVLTGLAGDVAEVCQYGAGQVTFTGDSGVTLRSASGLKTRAQYSCVALRWRTSTEVVVAGDLTT
jgi:hypothetical protein